MQNFNRIQKHTSSNDFFWRCSAKKILIAKGSVTPKSLITPDRKYFATPFYYLT